MAIAHRKKIAAETVLSLASISCPPPSAAEHDRVVFGAWFCAVFASATNALSARDAARLNEWETEGFVRPITA
jgi:hypothetical protein